MRAICAAVLTLEAFVILFAIPVAIQVAGVDSKVALAAGFGLALACFMVAGLLKRPWGYTAGWVIQAATISVGFVVPAMFFLGAIFALLWFMAIRLGRNVEASRSQRADAADSENAAERAAAAETESAGEPATEATGGTTSEAAAE